MNEKNVIVSSHIYHSQLTKWQVMAHYVVPAFLLFVVSLQQNVFLVTKISEEIFFVAKNTALVTKYEFRH